MTERMVTVMKRMVLDSIVKSIDTNFEESKHPRSDDGKFTSNGSHLNGAAKSGKKAGENVSLGMRSKESKVLNEAGLGSDLFADIADAGKTAQQKNECRNIAKNAISEMLGEDISKANAAITSREMQERCYIDDDQPWEDFMKLAKNPNLEKIFNEYIKAGVAIEKGSPRSLGDGYTAEGAKQYRNSLSKVLESEIQKRKRG